MVPNVKRVSHEFFSHRSGVDVNDDSVTVGFSRDPHDEDSLDGLLLQRSKDPRENIAGTDGVYVEIPIQRHAVYGGIVEAALRRDSFLVRFDDSTVHKMGGVQQILVRFDISGAEFTSIRAGVNYVFTGCPCFREDLGITG